LARSGLHLKTKNVKVFENYPPLTDNSLTKAFNKTKHPHLKITTVKEYMEVMFFEKTKEEKPHLRNHKIYL
jgi:short-subunit dehydrogenase involved in D-alanine esterification of teichoic acids